ncbi:MAG: ABC transporter permease [Magnetococcales bacterium]|nr:ABC transporter permease [Magnetococcales bacterium]
MEKSLNPDDGRSQNSIPQLIKSIWVIGNLHLQRRYCGSWLGAAWSWMHPVVHLLVLWIVFSNLFPAFENYFIYLASGLLPWIFFSQGIQTCSTVLVSNRNIFISSPVSYETHVLGTLTGEVLHFLVAFLLLILSVPLLGIPLGWHLLAVPLFLLNLILFTFSWAVIISFLTPIYRDISHFLTLFFTFGFWLMPIVYHWSNLPPPYKYIVKYNPLTLIISPFQIILHGGVVPNPHLIIISYLTVFTSIWLAWYVKRQLGKKIIYHL